MSLFSDPNDDSPANVDAAVRVWCLSRGCRTVTVSSFSPWLHAERVARKQQSVQKACTTHGGKVDGVSGSLRNGRVSCRSSADERDVFVFLAARTLLMTTQSQHHQPLNLQMQSAQPQQQVQQPQQQPPRRPVTVPTLQPRGWPVQHPPWR